VIRTSLARERGSCRAIRSREPMPRRARAAGGREDVHDDRGSASCRGREGAAAPIATPRQVSLSWLGAPAGDHAPIGAPRRCAAQGAGGRDRARLDAEATAALDQAGACGRARPTARHDLLWLRQANPASPSSAADAARAWPPSVPSCQAENPPGNRFCHQCGAALAPKRERAGRPPDQFASPTVYTPKHLARRSFTPGALRATQQVTYSSWTSRASRPSSAGLDPRKSTGS